MFKYQGYSKINEIDSDNLKTNLNQVILFGAMAMGSYAHSALKFLNIEPLCFCDNSAEKQKKGFEGLQVLSPKEAYEKYPDAYVHICTFNVVNSPAIEQQLVSLGFKHIYSFEFLYSIYLAKVSKRFIMPEDVFNIMTVFCNPDKNFIIRRALVSITTKCNLRCRDCASLMPYFKTTENFDKNKIITSVKKLCDSVDAIEELFIFGGEPLLHPDISEILNEISKINNVLRIYVISNGVMIPSEDLIKTMKAYDVDYVISNYGDLSKGIAGTLSASKQIQFRLTIKDMDFNWSKVEAPILYHYSESELAEKFQHCVNDPMACYNVIDGKFHVCSQSAFGTVLGAIPSVDGDFVDLLDSNLNTEMTRNQIFQLVEHKKTITACNYCKYGEVVPPAIQIKGHLECKKENE